MDTVFSIIVLVVAVTCVMIATQPTRPASRRRATIPAPASAATSSPRDPEPATAPYRWGDTQRWSRRDIQQAIAREHAFPGGEAVWPPR